MSHNEQPYKEELMHSIDQEQEVAEEVLSSLFCNVDVLIYSHLNVFLGPFCRALELPASKRNSVLDICFLGPCSLSINTQNYPVDGYNFHILRGWNVFLDGKVFYTVL